MLLTWVYLKLVASKPPCKINENMIKRELILFCFFVPVVNHSFLLTLFSQVTIFNAKIFSIATKKIQIIYSGCQWVFKLDLRGGFFGNPLMLRVISM